MENSKKDKKIHKEDFISKEGDRLNLLLQSNLSDSLVEIQIEDKKGAEEKINFVKFCLIFFEGNVNVDVNALKLFDYYLDNYSLHQKK